MSNLAQPRITADEVIALLRACPEYREIVKYSYLGSDLQEAARRFHESAEFAEVLRYTARGENPGRVLDLGAGRGIATYAFAKSHAELVYALEPDPSEEVGYGALRRLMGTLPYELLPCCGEKIPLPDASVDIVYARQVLHHAKDLGTMIRECARILAGGGVFLACREHVVDNDGQKNVFLRQHATHKYLGNENACRISEYEAAISGAGLTIQKVWGPWDSVMNAFPAVQTVEELRNFPRLALRRRLPRWSGLLARIPGVLWMYEKRLKRPQPGRLYSFLATKPAAGR